MKINCTNCGYSEKTDKDFFVKLIGGAMPVGGFWAWTTYLFAGTGFAMAIVIAIIGGGVAILIFKDEIVEWIINNDYKCPKCGKVEWKADVEEKATSDIKRLREEVSGQKIFEATTEQENLQKRVATIEFLLRTKGCEFETKEDGWIVLELSGYLKRIYTIEELEKYASSL